MTSTTYAHSKHMMGNNPDIPIDTMAYTITIYECLFVAKYHDFLRNYPESCRAKIP